MRKSSAGKIRPYSVFLPESAVSFALEVPPNGLEFILGAAYLMTDRAFVSIGGDRKKRLEVFLRDKDASAGAASRLEILARAFLAELETQKVRWAIAKNNLPIRQYIVEQSVLLSGGTAPREISRRRKAAP